MKFIEKLFSRFIINIGMDLGTANTVIFVARRGFTINEPSVIALEAGKILNIGAKAKEMMGKTDDRIQVIRPLADGVISDFAAGEAMIKGFIHMADIPPFLINRIVIGVPTGVTSVEKKAVIDSAMAAGARKVHLVYEPMAAAIGVGLDISNNQSHMIVDVGGGTTDIAVINYGHIVIDNTLRIAGDEMNEALIRYLRNQFNLKIGEVTAEKLKIEFGTLSPEADKFVEVKGLDLQNSLPRKVLLNSDIFVKALDKTIHSIISAILSTLDRLPPELASDLVDQGIVLSGGGALLRGLDDLLRDKLKIPVNRPPHALFCVAEGTKEILNHFEKYKAILIQ
jgi:rod shape-determining protein MreB